MTLDIETNRKAQKYPRREIIFRVLWAFAVPFFCCSPRLCWGWRRFMLRCFGASIGKNVQIFPSVKIFAPWYFTIGCDSSIGFNALVYNLGPVTIGDRVTISQRTHLCAGSHDYQDPTMRLTKPPIIIEDEAWVCADAFVGPGCIVGKGAVVAARAVVIKDVEDWSVVGGNPAKIIKKRIIHSGD
jgi:putative colanic acid biosynthesis acetyltransferase WcaF